MIASALEYLAVNEKRFVDELIEYARIPGVSAQSERAADLRRSAEWVASRCQRAGLAVETHETQGNPIVVAKSPDWDASRPTFLVYGHYDVQPPDPLDLWQTPPFEPRLAGRNLYARGASDNKGQHLAHINVAEAWIRAGGGLPCNLVFLIEGEEEVGSESLYDFLPSHAAELKCSAVVISDNGIPSLEYPGLTYALRGIAALEIRIEGPAKDLHSGLFGGSVENPAMALCQLLAKLRDARGRIAVPGYYDDVRPLTAFERRELAKLPFKEREYRKMLGVPMLFGEAGFTAEERRTARPTFEINGLTSGYQGEGSKTIVPAWASAKVTLRLVPDQTPAKAAKQVAARLKALCPPTVRLSVTLGHAGAPYLAPPTGALAIAARTAIQQGFGHPALLLREGGSIPIVAAFQRHLKAETLLIGMALPDDNAHSPNEKFSLDAFAAGMRTAAHLWPELTAAASAQTTAGGLTRPGAHRRGAKQGRRPGSK